MPEINCILFQNGFLKFEIRVFSKFVRDKKIKGRNAELVSLYKKRIRHTKKGSISGVFLLNYACPAGPKLNGIGYYFY
jgi:hypothetical protein